MIVFLGTMMVGYLARAGLVTVGLAGATLIMPVFLAIPWLAMAWYMQQRQLCPKCEFPLAYRQLGPSHGMLECPALCGYRRLVGDTGGRS